MRASRKSGSVRGRSRKGSVYPTTIKSQVFEGRNPKEVSQTTVAFDKPHSSAEIGRARVTEGTVNKAAAALA